MRADILNNPPVSGTIDEVQFDAVGDCTWVRFSNSSREWAGVFGKGDVANHINTVTVFDGEKHAFVIAGGQGYVVNLEERSLQYKTPDDCLQGSIAIPQKALVLTCDHTNLIIYDSAKKLWESDRVALDGIEFTEATSDQVSGYIWQIEGWYSFIFDVETREMAEQEFLSAEWDFLDKK